MAFPQVSGIGFFNDTGSGTSHQVNYPATLDSGDLLVLLLVCDGNVTITGGIPGAFTQIANQTSGAGEEAFVYYAVSDGTEDGGNFSYTTTETERCLAYMMRITAWHGTTAPEVTAAAATSSTPDPPSETASWGAEDNLWIAFMGGDSPMGVPTDAPANYQSNEDFRGSNAAGNVVMAVGTRELNAASDDPGTFTVPASEQWSAFTVVVRPAGGGGGAPPLHMLPLLGVGK